ncbi:MAG: hypothetical protein QF842_00225 [Candidatus Marinimicrobia bacterium]|jgi:hypothetical protein|nr:hypothetical protein [Candidatus Neomarinimicrobiota bacterium]MDP6611379.1 hypothetical protein [Candidatus Neomarinimicrobiota bacterium]
MFKLILLFSLFLTVDGHQTIIQFGGIEFRVVQNGEGDRRYIWLHGDEKTARLLLNDHIKTQPGKAFLINNEEREVKVGGLLLDPNRMFSRNGTKKNLQKMNANLSSSELNQTLDLLDKERGRFFDTVKPPPGGLLIALHNSIRNYSIKDELANSDEISLKNSEHPQHHNFFICTNENDFKILSKSPYNVVLQKSQTNDDGTLSRLAASKGIRYINIETRLGWLSVQKKMLNYVETHLP